MLLRAAAAAAAVAHRLLVIHPVRRIASLKVPWRRDEALDASINRDRRFRLASRLVREVLLSPDRRLLLRYLAKRRERIRLPVHVQTFLRRYPTLLSVSPPPDPVASPSPQLLSFLEFASRLQATHSPLLASRLAKLLMISSTRALPVAKIAAAKRDFGLPDDFLVSLVPRYPDLFRLVGDPGPDASGNAFLELASWDDRLAKSVIESRADREADVVGIRPRPNFTVKLPKGFYLKKEMRDWVRDWLELPYVSPYADTFGLNPASPEAEKRLIGVLHEVLSLSVERRMAVPIIGKFCEEFKLSNAFSNAFTRHPGIFYVSLKGGIKTVVLREAYDENGVLVDRDPMIELKERFMAIMDEGHSKYLEDLRRKNEMLQKERESATHKGTNVAKNIEEESMEESEEDEDKEYDIAQVDSEGRELL